MIRTWNTTYSIKSENRTLKFNRITRPKSEDIDLVNKEKISQIVDAIFSVDLRKKFKVKRKNVRNLQENIYLAQLEGVNINILHSLGGKYVPGITSPRGDQSHYLMLKVSRELEQLSQLDLVSHSVRVSARVST